LIPCCTFDAICGVVAEIVDGRSSGTRNTPWSALLPYLEK
jgi:hypothetical protein